MTDTTKPEDEFASAFAELQTPASSTPTAAAAATAAEAPVSPSTPAAPAAEATPSAAAAPVGTPEGNASGTSAPATPAAGAEAGTPTAAQPAATPSPETPPAGYVSAEQFAALQAQIEDMKKAAPAPTPAPAAAEPKPVYTDEEKAIVDEYLKEWPDTARGEALMRRAEYQQLVQYVWNQFAPRLDALEQVTQRTTTRTQYQEIKDLVSDYDQVRDATLKWIDTQPAYLKDAYQRVANEGSAQDVADLIGRFKKETGYVAPAVAATPAAVAATPAAAVAATPAAVAATPAPAAAAAAAALKPVATSRSNPSATPDPNDFDAAFKEFASAS